MLKKTKKGYWLLESFALQKGIIHGFSSRSFGDCNPLRSPSQNWLNLAKFLKTLALKKENLVLMEQVHQSKIKRVGQQNRGQIIKGVDGLVTQEKGLILGIHTADCLPILYYEPLAKIIGVAHAGWQGVLREIPRKMVQLIIKLGGLPENLLIGVGPYIGPCCYQVDKKRIDKFKKHFGSLEKMVKFTDGKNYLDLAVPTYFQLINLGIRRSNLEFSRVCTACQNQDFFSKRKDKPENYGGILSIIQLVKG